MRSLSNLLYNKIAQNTRNALLIFWYFYHSYIIVFLYHNSSTSCIICHLFNYFFKWYLIFSSDIPSITIYVRKNGSPASTYFLFAIAYNIVLLSSFVIRLPHETDMYASFDKCDTSFVGKVEVNQNVSINISTSSLTRPDICSC